MSREQPCLESVRPFDLAEERLAVLGVADGARRNQQRAFGAERLRLPAVVREDIANARDRQRQEPATRVDAFAQPRYTCHALELADLSLLDIGDEQARGICSEIDRGDAGH